MKLPPRSPCDMGWLLPSPTLEHIKLAWEFEVHMTHSTCYKKRDYSRSCAFKDIQRMGKRLMLNFAPLERGAKLCTSTLMCGLEWSSPHNLSRKSPQLQYEISRERIIARERIIYWSPVTANDDTLTKVTSDTPHGHLVLFSSHSTEEILSEK